MPNAATPNQMINIDRRIKGHIQTLENALGSLMRLRELVDQAHLDEELLKDIKRASDEIEALMMNVEIMIEESR